MSLADSATLLGNGDTDNGSGDVVGGEFLPEDARLLHRITVSGGSNLVNGNMSFGEEGVIVFDENIPATYPLSLLGEIPSSKRSKCSGTNVGEGFDEDEAEPDIKFVPRLAPPKDEHIIGR